MDTGLILDRFQGVQGREGHWTAKCPCHDDKKASLSIDVKAGKDGRRRVMLHDHAGCATESILAAIGLSYADLVLDPDPDFSGSSGFSGNGSRKNGGKPGENRGKPAGRQKAAGEEAKKMRKLAEDGIQVHTVGPKDGEAEGSGNGGRAENAGGAGGKGSSAGGASGNGSSAGGRAENAGGAGGNGGKGGAKEEAGPEIDWKNPDRIYSYTDADGKEVFQVVRYHFLGGVKGKTFRQRMRATAEQIREAEGRGGVCRGADGNDVKVGRDGWIHKVPEKVRDSVIYRMPEALRAIREGRPVYVVEGEKDVETLEGLGYAATCNAGGAGKWRENFSEILAGADMIILPDNDPRNDQGGYPGQDHAYDVALKSFGKAKRIRIVDLREACPELPEKGDISDLISIMGSAAGMDALQRQIQGTKDFDPEMVPFWLTPMEQAGRLYAQVSGYGVRDGCIVQMSGDSVKPLSDFVVIPRGEVIQDDGVTEKRVFILDGWNARGIRLPRVTVSGAELDNLNWMSEKWGMRAALVPGSTTKQKVVWCIKKVGQLVSKETREYTHTGWRRFRGKWCFLYQGGAIGAEGVTVHMEQGLDTYRLDGNGRPEFLKMTPKEAAGKSLEILEVARREITVALLGTVFLAPLREFLSQTDITPAFSLFLHGQTQTRKSTIVALAMSHFGNFHAKNAPANFRSTGNYITAKAFLAKDMPLWVDDFHPTDSQQEKRQMNATAQTLARAFGDGADRGRLNSDRSLQSSRPPRSIAIITGEDLPAVGASGLARFFILDVGKGDVPTEDGRLTKLQEDARMGWLQASMRGYIEWLAKNTEKLPEYLHAQFLQYREMIRKIGAGDQERAPEAVACILIGYNMMTSYFVHIGAITKDERVKMGEEALRILTDASRRQSREMESEKPTRIFLDTIGEMLASRKVWIKDLIIVDEKIKNEPLPMDDMIGYRDNEYYYLLPNMAYRAVSAVCRQEGHEFPVSLKALYKHLVADGVVRGLKEGESPARPKTIMGKTVRVLRLPAKMLDGNGEGAEQEKQMTMLRVEEELPDAWKDGKGD